MKRMLILAKILELKQNSTLISLKKLFISESYVLYALNYKQILFATKY